MNLVSSVRVGAREFAWFFKGVMGEDAYDRYLEHHRRSGCAEPAMSAKEFWRDRTDRQDANPQGRCC